MKLNPTIKTKKDVTLSTLHISMRPALLVAAQIWDRLGLTLTITSTTEGEHSAGSLHYYGLAMDLRTWRRGLPGIQWSRNRRNFVTRLLRETLKAIDPNFQVIAKSNHIHIEYDTLKPKDRIDIRQHIHPTDLKELAKVSA